MLLGVHCSVSGGLEKAFDEARHLGIDTFQIFTRNQRQWRAKPISNQERQAFARAFATSNVKIAFAHASYLINLASDNDDLWKRSTEAMIAEVERCHSLGLAYAIVHPGAAKGLDENIAIERAAMAIRRVIEATPGNSVKIVVENTAGQGTTLGYDFQQLATIIELTGSQRVAACFDTCHAFAAGYDISDQKGFEETFNRWDKTIGIKKLAAIHLNESKTPLGSRVDRHAHIGQGVIGTEAFRLMLKTFPNIPKVLETPKEDNMDEKNLQVLRSLL